jgi:XTP/dITP diphosphohydrolase
MKISKIVIATRNDHKAAELAAMLGNSLEIKTLRDFSDAPEVVEDAPSFQGNATKKAVTLANWLAKLKCEDAFVLADDSGLEVDALNGDPGVRSARFAAATDKGNSPDTANNEKLLRLLAPIPRPWTARFRCVIAFTPIPSAGSVVASKTCLLEEAELATRLFEGACEGQIIPTAKGAHGFGYDPLFVPKGYTETFAELGEDVKNKISHRAQAMGKFLSAIRVE